MQWTTMLLPLGLLPACAAELPAPATPPPALSTAPTAPTALVPPAPAPSAPEPRLTVSTIEPTSPPRPGPSKPIAMGSPMGVYIAGMRDRIRAAFGAKYPCPSYAASAGASSGSDLRTRLEIVLEPDTGKVARVGVLASSGVTAFDDAVLGAVGESAPFGKVPEVVVSPDRLAYIHWEYWQKSARPCFPG
jgi:outer membrane biosynthesis protein TonB